MKIFFSPHNDDEVLFGSFTLLREKPHVIICLRADHGVDYKIREWETAKAMAELGCSWEQWPIKNDYPNWNDVMLGMKSILREGIQHVWLPWPEESGSRIQHRELGAIGSLVYRHIPKTYYLTYKEGVPYPRTKGTEVPVLDPKWAIRKHRALLCYESQILAPDGYHHFLNDQHEYYI